jgi:hypothetical protein
MPDVRWLVVQGCFDIPLQGDASSDCEQWLLSLAGNGDLQSLVGLPIYFDLGSVFLVGASYRGVVFGRKRPCQRSFHGLFERVESMQVVCIVVIVDDPPKFELIDCHDRVITLTEQFSQMNGVASYRFATRSRSRIGSRRVTACTAFLPLPPRTTLVGFLTRRSPVDGPVFQ